MKDNHGNESLLKTWGFIGIMLVFILFKATLAFFVISDMCQPTWDYRTVRDVPASSPYAVYPMVLQHIRGKNGQ